MIFKKILRPLKNSPYKHEKIGSFTSVMKIRMRAGTSLRLPLHIGNLGFEKNYDFPIEKVRQHFCRLTHENHMIDT